MTRKQHLLFTTASITVLSLITLSQLPHYVHSQLKPQFRGATKNEAPKKTPTKDLEQQNLDQILGQLNTTQPTNPSINFFTPNPINDIIKTLPTPNPPPTNVKDNNAFQNFIIPKDMDDPDMIYIHFVCHSHDDVGWQQTPEGYYDRKVRKIFNSLVPALKANPQRKFSQTEIYFFARWWKEIGESVKKEVRQLVKEGRIEFINGGWVSNDEACPTYEEIIMNYMTGHAFLQKEFGITTRVAWNPDSFGHSVTTPELLKDLGFDALFFARVDDDEKNYRKQRQEMEFMWNPKVQTSKGEIQSSDNGIFTHVMFELYQGSCGIDIWNYYDDEPSNRQNYQTKLNQMKMDMQSFINCIKGYAKSYKTNQILFTLGSDFAYQFAGATFDYVDGLRNIINGNMQGFKVYAFYSTVQNYYESAQKSILRMNKQWPVASKDFFPLNSHFPGHYWSGYFSSRPNFKSQIQELASNNLASDQLYIIDYLRNRKDLKVFDSQQLYINSVDSLNQGLATQIHHDTITGTSPNDVIKKESEAFYQIEKKNAGVLLNLLDRLTRTERGIKLNNISQCIHKLNERRICPIARFSNDMETKTYFIVYNPNIEPQIYTELNMFGPKASALKWDPITQMFNAVENELFCFKNSLNQEECDLYIYDEIKPFQYQIYQIENSNSQKPVESLGFELASISRDEAVIVVDCDPKKDKIENQHLILQVDKCDNSILKLTYTLKSQDGTQSEMSKQLQFDFRYYNPSYHGQYRNSGVYVFKTEESDSTAYEHKIVDIETFAGTQLQQIVVYYKSSQGILHYVKMILEKDAEEIEFDIFMERIDREKKAKGQEVTINWSSRDIENEGIFFTDANSLKIMKRDARKDEYRPYLTSANKDFYPHKAFYPVTSGIFIENQNQTAKDQFQMVVMNDRSQAGSAYHKGRIEFLLNRYGTTNDELGMWEAMADQTPDGKGPNVTAKFWLSLTKKRALAFDKIFKRHTLNQNQPLTFHTSKFDSQKLSSLSQAGQYLNDVQAKNFRNVIDTLKIVDMQILPVDEMYDTFYLRLTRSDNFQKVTKTLLNQLCNYALGSKCNKFTNLEQIYLNGNEATEGKLPSDQYLEKDQQIIELYKFV
eukprot:403338949